MPNTDRNEAPLGGVLVVEFDQELGTYAGRLLADLGADVVLVESTKDSQNRRRPPLQKDPDGSVVSLRFEYHNVGKTIMAFDPEDIDNRRALIELLSAADVVLGGGTAAWPERFGIDHETLRSVTTKAVVVHMTPFGLSGPYAEHEATDLTCLAMGGLMSMAGYGDGAPLQIAGEQAFNMAATFAALSAVLALYACEIDGRGEVIDLSVQESVSMALENAPQYYDLEGTIRTRTTGMQRSAGAGLYCCADGFVYLFVGGIASSRFWRRFVTWLRELEVPRASELAEPWWEDRSHLETDAAKDIFLAIVDPFMRAHSKNWLYHEAQRRGIPLTPVRNMLDVLDSAQLRAREFFGAFPLPSGREAIAPGFPYRFSKTPCRRVATAPADRRTPEEVAALVAARSSVAEAAR